MSLTGLIRWIVALVIGWTFVAIGIGASGTRLPDQEEALSIGSVSPGVEAMPAHWPEDGRYELIDRTSGRRTPIRLPAGERWSDISVAPWRGPDGGIEAAGRWVNKDRDDLVGWALFRVSDGAVLSRIPTELLATGRPCWVPGQPRTIVYAASDGQLYRCQLASDGRQPIAAPRRVFASGLVELSDAIAWDVRPPGDGDPMIMDPIWPTAPALRRWVFAAIIPLERSRKGTVYGPARLWWLELSEDALSIVAAGRLILPADNGADRAGIDERFPNLAVGPDGSVRLVYEEHGPHKKAAGLRSAVIDFDARTGRPRVAAVEVRAASAPIGEIEPAPMLISADGATAFGYTPTGRLAPFPVR